MGSDTHCTASCEQEPILTPPPEAVSAPTPNTPTPATQQHCAPAGETILPAAHTEDGFEAFDEGAEIATGGLSDDDGESCARCRPSTTAAVRLLAPEGVAAPRLSTLRWADADEETEAAAAEADEKKSSEKKPSANLDSEPVVSHKKRTLRSAPRPKLTRKSTPPAEEASVTAQAAGGDSWDDTYAQPANAPAPMQHYDYYGGGGGHYPRADYFEHPHPYYQNHNSTQQAQQVEQPAPAATAKPKVMCCYYKQKGFCKMGDACWYSHDGEPGDDTPCHYGAKCKAGHAHLCHTGNSAAAPLKQATKNSKKNQKVASTGPVAPSPAGTVLPSARPRPPQKRQSTTPEEAEVIQELAAASPKETHPEESEGSNQLSSSPSIDEQPEEIAGPYNSEHMQAIPDPYATSFDHYNHHQGYDEYTMYMWEQEQMMYQQQQYGSGTYNRRQNMNNNNHSQQRRSKSRPLQSTDMPCAYCGNSGSVMVQEFPVYNGNEVSKGMRAMCRSCNRTYAL